MGKYWKIKDNDSGGGCQCPNLMGVGRLRDIGSDGGLMCPNSMGVRR
jgi:hypothetical protein